MRITRKPAMKYYVFRHSKYGGIVSEEYWTGKFIESGRAAKTNKTSRAMAFDTARDAYDGAGEHSILNWWRVGLRIANNGVSDRAYQQLEA